MARGEFSKHNSVFIVIAIMAVAGFVLFSGEFVPSDISGAVTSENWFDNNWQYRLPVSFTQTTQITSDRGVTEVTLVTQDANLNNDCSDVRVTDSQNIEASFKIAGCTPTSAIVQFEYPAGSPNYNYYIYYGNVIAIAPPTALTLWRNRASPPTLRGEAPSSTTFSDGYVYLTGGSKAANAFEEYNPVSNTWAQKPNIPENVGAGSATVGKDNKLHIIGGDQNMAGTLLFDFRWLEPVFQITPDLNFPRAWFAATNENDRIHVFGGRGLDGSGQLITTDTHEILFGNQWVPGPPMITKRSYMGAAKVAGNKIHVIGGQTEFFNPTPRNDVFDPATQTWEAKAFLPTPSRALAVTSTNNIIYAIGGLPNQRILQIYNAATNTWTIGESLPGDKRAATATAVSGKIYVMGGLGDEPGMYEYSIPNWGLSNIVLSLPETLDDDNDGVTNANDLCPNTPAGEAVNSIGCSASQLDMDSDTYFGDVDCNDNNAAINPGATEVCDDAIDNNCDSLTDQQDTVTCGTEVPLPDADGDGYTADVDCNDNNAAIYPGAPVVCGGAIDDSNCDGLTDEVVACEIDDNDGDSVVNANDLCPNTPIGEAVNVNGCSNSQIDADGDSYTADVDCNDNNAAINPGAPEICDGIDNNCSNEIIAAIDEGGVCSGTEDEDNDGVVNANDLCPSTPLGEAVDSNGCTALSLDVDSDTYLRDVDCNDNDAAINPGATEICDDGIDNNCDSLTDQQDTVTCEIVAPQDDDNDGVTGAADLCPSTPA